MAKKPSRIVLDTNIFIYFLISNTFNLLDTQLKNSEVKLLFSDELLSEFLEVAGRPKFRKYFTEKDLIRLLTGINGYAEFVAVKSSVNVCRDLKDNFLLALCKDGKADFLLTGDDDLLSLKKFRHTRIIKFSDFIHLKR